MSDAAQVIFQNVVKTSPFPVTSRYSQTPVASLTTADGTQIVYLRRRFVPSPDSFESFLEHTVMQGDRLDNITAKYLGDPEQFWRLCDANNAMEPDELTAAIGRKLRITLPEGIPGQPNA
jgi:hypothetical protein